MTNTETRRSQRDALAAWDYWCAVDRREREREEARAVDAWVPARLTAREWAARPTVYRP